MGFQIFALTAGGKYPTYGRKLPGRDKCPGGIPAYTRPVMPIQHPRTLLHYNLTV